MITVKPVDANPPEIHTSAPEGFVNENAPIGTEVIDVEGKPLVLEVSDKDLVSTLNFFFSRFSNLYKY